jgi:signal peptidase I
MKVYEIYEHPERGRKAVKVGFSWPGFFFNYIWALTKRLWLGFAIYIVLVLWVEFYRGIPGAPSNLILSVGTMATGLLVLSAYGIYGNRWIARSLIRRGYSLVSKIMGRSRGDALRRFEESSEVEEPVLSPIRQYGPIIFLGFVCCSLLLFRATLVAYYIPAPSMLNTLKINDRIFVYRFAYTFSQPKIGDIIVFYVPETIPNYDPDKPIWINRIVGLEGDHVTIEDNHLMVNGQKVANPPFLAVNTYFNELGKWKSFEGLTVGANDVLVFGDNSANSYDGRYWGTVPEENIIGKVVFRFWPPHRMGEIYDASVTPFEE